MIRSIWFSVELPANNARPEGEGRGEGALMTGGGGALMTGGGGVLMTEREGHS